MYSSYAINKYGEVFEAIVDAFKPINAVELGVLYGYSTFYIAKAMKKNGRGQITSYDLFEDYPYRHANYEDIVNFFRHCPQVTIKKADAFEVAKDYPPLSIDLLHVDLSNTGETVKKVMDIWGYKIMQGGIILFEGGTEESDHVEWRVKYGAPSIKKEIETNKIIQEQYIYGTYLKYPGLTMLLGKR